MNPGYYRKVKYHINSSFYLTTNMKIIILITLLLLAHRVERLYTERFYIAVSHLSYQIILTNQSKNKPCMAKKLDHYLNKVDSTVAGLRNFQRKYCCIQDQSKQLIKMYCPSTGHFPLINCLHLFICKSVYGVFPKDKKAIINR